MRVVTVAATVLTLTFGCAAPAPSAPLAEPPLAMSSTVAADPGDASRGFSAFSPPQGRFTVWVPAGWMKLDDASGTTFTDHLNTIRIDQRPATAPPTAQSVRLHDLPGIADGTANDAAADIDVVQRRAGPAVLVTYRRRAAPSRVDPKVSVDAVERYQFWRDGQEVILTLSAPAGFDVSALWWAVTDSLRWR